MTGGRAVILGPTGRNFAAGMSGGVAYVYDPEDRFLVKCNLETVALENVETPEDNAELKQIIENHQQYTGSETAREILSEWETAVSKFVKVMPVDYKRALEELAAEAAQA
jgi:glutamate synthase (NADPH/NADH) large chain